MGTSLLTSQSTKHSFSYAQLGDSVIICNGHDANAVYDIRTGTTKTLGMAAPGAMGTPPADQSSGLVNGTVKYRTRWRDQSTNTISLPSASSTHTCVNQKVRVTHPGSAPSRASHWIVERIIDGGKTYYPVNYTAASPDGTPVGTAFYDDDTADATLQQNEPLSSNQGQPGNRAFCWVNGSIVFMGGDRVYQGKVNVTNGSAAVVRSSGEDFTSDMIGDDFSVDGEVDGVTYRISAFTDGDNITLASTFAGSTALAAPCSITGQGNQINWSESGTPEYYGSAVVGGLSNSVLIGDDGGSIRGGIGLGLAGSLVCTGDRQYLWSYRYNPQSKFLGGDGEIVPLPARRGTFNNNSMLRVDGIVYGMDRYGVWAFNIGGSAKEIGQNIARSWRDLDFGKFANYWCAYYPLYQQIYFFVVEPGHTHPNKSYQYSLSQQKFTGSRTYDVECPCGVMLPGGSDELRVGFFTAANGSAKSYFNFDAIGTTAGVPPTSTIKGTATAGSSTSVTDSGAAFETVGDGCDGAPITIVRAADNSAETQQIVSNTATVLTTTTFTGTAPTSGDTYILGTIPTKWRTARLDMGQPTIRKKIKGIWVWIVYDANAVDLKLKAFYDGNSQPETYDHTLSEDGVTHTSGDDAAVIDPGATDANSANIHRHWIECPGDKWVQDVQFEFSSIDSGAPWKIIKASVSFDWENAPDEDKHAMGGIS